MRERGRETERIEVTEKERVKEWQRTRTRQFALLKFPTSLFFSLFHSFSLLAFHFSIIPLLNYTWISSF